MMRALLARELRLAWRSGAEILNPLWFFLIVITLFPFGVGAAPQLLAQIAPGVVWVAALLAALLVMDRLFRDDWQDGSLEQLMLLPTPLVAVVLVKVVAHWMMSGLPLLIVSPLAALLLGMSLHDAGVLALTLLLGTPTLSFLGAVGGWPDSRPEARRRPAELLVLPLAVPLLIFATAACQAAAAGLPVGGYLAMLAAFLTASATLCPFATAAALRLTVR
ncbi:heme exporter permease component [Klebsiella pneumoniae]|uniref:Heme exporter protein B n=1 Tax=Klebsiella pneumoniae TaxID=573 RepID=A0A3S4GP21_KLEPN|nr:heme exporter permease component [Klebsiella pneumoniae]